MNKLITKTLVVLIGSRSCERQRRILCDVESHSSRFETALKVFAVESVLELIGK